MNKLISSRQSGTATLSHSVTSAQADWFTGVELGGLHLVGNVQGGVESGLELSGLEDDIDQQSRFFGEEGDIGTNEYYTFQLFTSTLIAREKNVFHISTAHNYHPDLGTPPNILYLASIWGN